MMDTTLFKKSMACKCPNCHQGLLYNPGFSLTLQDACDQCGLDYTKNDSADGPAVLLIFILGFLLVPLALFLDAMVRPPLWFHAILWSLIALVLTVGLLKPLKSYIIALQFKHRPGDWE